MSKINNLLPKLNTAYKILDILEEEKYKILLQDKMRILYISGGIGTVISFTSMAIEGILIYDISHPFLNTTLVYTLLVSILLLEVLSSYVDNAYNFLQGGFVKFGIIDKLTNKIGNALDEKDTKLPANFSSSLGYFNYEIIGIIQSIGRVVMALALIITSASNLKTPMFIGSVLILTVLMYSGKKFFAITKQIYKQHSNSKEVDKHTKMLRWVFPAITNTAHESVIVVTIMLTRLHVFTLIAQVGLVGLVLSNAWSSITKVQQIKIAGEILEKIYKKLVNIEKKYTINQKSFLKLCDMCVPSEKTMALSAKNHSLILKNFTPMVFTNKKFKKSRKYSIELKPGIYQLEGVNGVGKTTLLKALTLPLTNRVELSSGEVALCGEPFFAESNSVAKHNDKYIYVGVSGPQADLNKINQAKFKKYKNLFKFLKSIDLSKRQHSEGELIIGQICTAYQKLLDQTTVEKLVFIDEGISRIYGEVEYDIQSDIIELITDIANSKPDVIIIVVDHMTSLEFAQHLKLTKYSIVKKKVSRVPNGNKFASVDLGSPDVKKFASVDLGSPDVEAVDPNSKIVIVKEPKTPENQ